VVTLPLVLCRKRDHQAPDPDQIGRRSQWAIGYDEALGRLVFAFEDRAVGIVGRLYRGTQ
jgi:hypothetical protein